MARIFKLMTFAALLAASAVSAACDPFKHDGFTTGPTQTVSLSASGLVTDQDGAPLAGAAVTASAYSSASAMTDEAGRFEISSVNVAVGGNISFIASKEGYVSRTIVVAKATDHVDVTIAITIQDVLPMDEDLYLSLSPTASAVRLGPSNNSGLLTNAKQFVFSAGEGEKIEVELFWDRTGDIELAMGIVNGQVSHATESGQSLTISGSDGPGTLAIGIVSGTICKPLDIRLVTRLVR